MRFNFEVSCIEVNEATLDWGPYRFDLKPLIPDPVGDPIKIVEVFSFLDGVDTTEHLISRSTIVPGRNAVDIWFNWPGSELVGQHIIVFDVTLVSDGTNRFKHGYVEVS